MNTPDTTIRAIVVPLVLLGGHAITARLVTERLGVGSLSGHSSASCLRSHARAPILGSTVVVSLLTVSWRTS